MGEERLRRVIVAGQFGLCQGRVDFLVADVMEKNRRAALAAFEFRDQVVQALRDVGRDRTLAKGADRVVLHGGLILGQGSGQEDGTNWRKGKAWASQQR